eukprot:824267-Lingulodinium_polyedra.AAC.1
MFAHWRPPRAAGQPLLPAAAAEAPAAPQLGSRPKARPKGAPARLGFVARAVLAGAMLFTSGQGP